MACVIVLGCFRSGTSAVAGALHHLGVFMGSRFDEPNKNNPKGFWEDIEFKDLHFKLGLRSPVVDEFYESLVRSREMDCPLWGVKDPMLCKHLGKITPLLKDHRLIVCRRPAEEIAQSMANAVGIGEPLMFMPLVEDYLTDMNEAIAEYRGPILEVQKRDPMIDILEPIADFVGLPVTDAARKFLS